MKREFIIYTLKIKTKIFFINWKALWQNLYVFLYCFLWRIRVQVQTIYNPLWDLFEKQYNCSMSGETENRFCTINKYLKKFTNLLRYFFTVWCKNIKKLFYMIQNCDLNWSNVLVSITGFIQGKVLQKEEIQAIFMIDFGLHFNVHSQIM